LHWFLGLFIGSKFKGTKCPKTQRRNGRKSKERKIKKEKKEEKTFNQSAEENGAEEHPRPRGQFWTISISPAAVIGLILFFYA